MLQRAASELFNDGAPAPRLIGKVCSCIEEMLGCVCEAPRGSACSLGNERLLSDGKGTDQTTPCIVTLLVTQLVNPLWSVKIAEKVRMGSPYPCVVLG